MKIRGRKTKKCPRCGNECLLSQVECDECGLLFARVEIATNKDGKKRLRRGQKEQVIYVKKYPSDVKKWKMILLTVFLGLFGAHYFYVGKWKKGLCMLLYFFAVLFMGVIFNAYFLTIWSGQFFSIFGPLTGIYTLIWLFDIYRVSFNRFKMPVSIISEQEEKEYLAEKQAKKEAKQKRKEFLKEEKVDNVVNITDAKKEDSKKEEKAETPVKKTSKPKQSSGSKTVKKVKKTDGDKKWE